jgi:hypothetical protein
MSLMLDSHNNLIKDNKMNIEAFMGYVTKTWVGSVDKS